MKNQTSTYSRMFLVSPTVYEKLLTCIDEKDKKTTQDLNSSKEKKQRPSDEYIQGLNIESFNEPREVENNDQNTEQELNMDVEPESESTDDIFEEDQNQSGFVETSEPEIMPEIRQTNILTTPCVQSEKGEVIPQGGLVYRPRNQQFKAVKNPMISIPKLTQEEIDFHTNPRPQSKPFIFKKPVLTIPKLSQDEIDIYTKKSTPQISIPRLSQKQIGQRDVMNRPILKQPVLSLPRLQRAEIEAYSGNQPILSIPRLQQAEIDAFSGSQKPNKLQGIQKKGASKIKNFQCPICMKLWRSKWDLRRHTDSVHSNLKASQQALPLPDTDDVMQEPDNFPIWARTRSHKRSATQAKLPNLKNNKFRPPGGDDENEYQSWK